ncbi:Acetyltransferase (GNAT) family protein [uncultured archaeon]|nr:Acetyltransferase (GNAT) family protein [uncultured archaeon]
MVLPAQRKRPILRKGRLTAVGFAKKLPNEVGSKNWAFYKRELKHSSRRKLSEKVTLVRKLPTRQAESGLVGITNKKGKTLGTATFMYIQKEGRKYFLISEVDVLVGYKREGFLNQMLSEISFIAKKSGINRLELDVDSKNSTAIEAYSKFGFKKVSEHAEKTEPENIIYRFAKILD